MGEDFRPDDTYGPYDQYREVQTPFGEWGIPAGQVLTFDAEGRPIFTEADSGAAVAQASTIEEPESISEGDPSASDEVDEVTVGSEG